MNTVPLKSWATPLAIGAFTISAVTGLFIFFDIEIGIVEPVHKWLSWLLVCGVMLHVLSNWKPFTGYFSQKAAIAVIGAAILFTITSLLPIFGDEEKDSGKENAGKVAVQALESSSLETIALVIKTTPQKLVEQLGKSGILVKDASLTIQEIAKNNSKEGKAVLGTLLQQPKGSGAKNVDKD
ncbi:MAG: DUF4405 domain-containing protein [Chlorobiales bacterium]|nr:DUF4405 domain-containing protein [Chlorobiales bacterium]